MTVDPNLPAEFFELVGRIVVSAAIFENELADLAATVDEPGAENKLPPDADGEEVVAAYRERLDPHAGAPGTSLITKIRTRGLPLLPTIYADDFTTYLDRAHDALDRRHDVVHNVWLFLGHDEADYLGFRGLPPHKRDDSGEAHTSMAWNRQALVDLLAEFRDLMHWLPIWRDRIDTFGSSKNAK